MTLMEAEEVREDYISAMTSLTTLPASLELGL